jgi:hypothetical protein
LKGSRRSPLACLSCVGLVALLVFVPSAAADVTLGSSLADANDSTFGGGPGVIAYQQAAPEEVLAAPDSGTITQWSVNSTETGAEYRLRILRPAGGEFTAVGTSATQAVPGVGGERRGPFAVNLPVRSGDRIALEVLKGLGAPMNNTLASIGDELNYLQAPLAEGESKGPPGPAGGSQELLLQATLKADPPIDLTLPAVSGEARVGTPLTAAEGTWENASSFAFQWVRCLEAACTPIPSATASSYVPTSADEGQQLRVDVTAKGDGGQTVASSALTAGVKAGPAPAPTNTVAPTISGEARATETLVGTIGSWTAGPTSFETQWLRCSSASGTECAPIPGATSLAYPVTRSDVGFTLRLRVTAMNSAGFGTAESAPTKIVQPEVVKAVISVIPGAPCTGESVELSAAGSKTPDPPIVSYEYTYFEFPRADDEAFGYAPEEKFFLDIQVDGYKADTNPKLIAKGTSPYVTHIFTWNRLNGSTPLDSNDYAKVPEGTPLRDPVEISLKVTDFSGASATTTTKPIEFRPHYAGSTRAEDKCRNTVRPRPLLIRPTKVTVGRTYVQAGTRCASVAPCAGSLVVQTVGPLLHVRLARPTAKQKPVAVAVLPFFSVAGRHSAKLRARLTKAGARMLRRGSALPVILQLTSFAPSGAKSVQSVHVRLRRR